MAWIESDQSLQRHPKTITAAAMLKINRVTMIGHLHCLWWWALDIASPDGYLGDNILPEMLAEAAEFPVKKAESFVNALLNCGGSKKGFLEERDGKLYLHDWFDFGGKLTQKRLIDKERKRKERHQLSNGQPAGHPKDSPSDVAGRVPKSTQPREDNTTGQDRITTTPTPTPPPLPPEDEGGCSSFSESLVDEEGVKEFYRMWAEEKMGDVTEIIRDELNECFKAFTLEELTGAIKACSMTGHRTMVYFKGVLKNIESGNVHQPGHRRHSSWNEDPDKYIKGPYGHVVQR